ncbi:MAG TPA: hypothetical protein VLY45_07745 [Nitrospiria bacterium]|nr:hypothetical protein [Nitrospiria bacterium]
MSGFSIRPAPQGVYPAVCHVGEVYVPLTAEGIERLRAAAQAPSVFYPVLLEVAGVSAYMKDTVARVWAAGDPAEQTQRLRHDLSALPAG